MRQWHPRRRWQATKLNQKATDENINRLNWCGAERTVMDTRQLNDIRFDNAGITKKKKKKFINWTYQSFYSFMGTSDADCKIYIKTSNEFPTKHIFSRHLCRCYCCADEEEKNGTICRSASPIHGDRMGGQTRPDTHSDVKHFWHFQFECIPNDAVRNLFVLD